MLATVHRMHERVVGELPEDAGRHHPAGTPYAALDPQLMLWTVAVIADSAIWFYEHLVRPLSASEREALWQDYMRFAELFRTPRAALPPTYAAFRAWYEDQLVGPGPVPHRGGPLHGSRLGLRDPDVREPHARQAHPRPRHARLAARRGCASSTACATRRPRPPACAAVLAAARAWRDRWCRPRCRRGSCMPEFEGVAAVERRRIERGQPTPQIV